MALVTITQTTPNPPLQLESDDLVLRAWYTNDFVAADHATPVLGWNQTTGEGFYYEIVCSRDVDDNLVIPAFAVQPTTESNPTAGFYGQLYVGGAPNQMIFGAGAATGGWQIPTDYGASVTFAQLATYNATVFILYPPNTYFTAAQVIATINQMAALGDQQAAIAVVSNTATGTELATAINSIIGVLEEYGQIAS